MGFPDARASLRWSRRWKKVNRERRRRAPGGKFWEVPVMRLNDEKTGSCAGYRCAAADGPLWRKSSQIYQIYLKYVAPEDIPFYSIDEVFIDLTSYLETYHMSAHELTTRMIGMCERNRNYGCGDRNESVPCKDRDGYYGKAHRT